MRREHGAHVIEGTRVDQIDLSATVLLGRRSEELDRDLERRRRRCGEKGTNVADGYQVMAAAVTHVGQRVVLREEGDRLSALRTDASAKGGLESADPALDLMALAPKERGDRV